MKAITRSLALVGLFSFASIALPVLGQSSTTWTGSSDTVFSNGSNWSAGAPTNSTTGTYVQFNGAPTANLPQLTASQSVAGISFGSIAGWNLSSSGGAILTLGLGDGIAAIDATNISSGTDTISSNLGLSSGTSAQIFAVGAGGTLALTGVISGSDTKGLNFGASGSTGNIIASGANTYTAVNNINFGTVTLGAGGTLGSILNNLGGASTGTLDLNGQNLSVGSFGGSENITNSGSADVTLTVGAAGTYNGVLSDGPTNKIALVFNNTAQGILSNTNTYSGGTILNGNGGIRVNTAFNAFGTGTITLNNSSSIQFTTTGTLANNLVINGTNGLVAPSPSGKSTFSGSLSGAGSLRLSGNNGGAGTSGSIFTGDFSAFTGTVDVEFNAFDGTSSKEARLNLTNVTSGTASTGFVLGAADPGTARGFDILEYLGTGTTSTVSLGSLAGNSQGLLRNGTAANTTTFEIGAQNISTTYTGQITNGGTGIVTAITKVGTGTLTLGGVSTNTGVTNINAGTLNVTGGLASTTQSGTVTFGQSTVTVASTAGLTIGQTVTGAGLPGGETISGINSTTNVVSLTSNATSTGSTTTSLTFGSTSALGTGAVNVNTGGTLNLGSADALHYNSGAGINIQGGNLTTSVANTTVGPNINMSSGGISIGGRGTAASLTLASATSFSMIGGTLTFDLGANSATSDQILSLGGTFSLTGGTVDVNQLAGFDFTQSYDILSGFTSGTVSGLTFTGIDGYTASLSNLGVLSFTAISVPEPSTWAMMLGGVMLLIVVQHKRRAFSKSNTAEIL